MACFPRLVQTGAGAGSEDAAAAERRVAMRAKMRKKLKENKGSFWSDTDSEEEDGADEPPLKRVREK